MEATVHTDVPTTEARNRRLISHKLEKLSQTRLSLNVKTELDEMSISASADAALARNMSMTARVNSEATALGYVASTDQGAVSLYLSDSMYFEKGNLAAALSTSASYPARLSGPAFDGVGEGLSSDGDTALT